MELDELQRNTVIYSAFKYAIKRHSDEAFSVAQYIERHAEDLGKGTRSQIYSDIKYHLRERTHGLTAGVWEAVAEALSRKHGKDNG